MIVALWSAQVKPHLEHHVWFWAPKHKTVVDLLKKVQGKDVKIQGREILVYNESLRVLELFCLENRGWGGSYTCKYRMGGNK